MHSFDNQKLAFGRSDLKAKLFTLLPGGNIGIIDSTDIGQLDFDKLVNESDPQINLKFRRWDKQLKSKEDVNKLFGI